MGAVKIDYDKVEWKPFLTPPGRGGGGTINPGLRYKPVKVGELGFSKFAWTAGGTEDWHSHDVEPQIVMCLSGKIEFGVKDGDVPRKEMLLPGDVLAIPTGVPHMATAIEDTILVVMWAPMRRFSADAIIV